MCPDNTISGFNTELKLDPKIQLQMRAIEAKLNSEKIGYELSVVPNPQTFANMRLQQSLLGYKQKDKSPFKRGKGPVKPRKADTSDLLKAIMKIPAIKNAIERTKGKAVGNLKRDWKNLSGGGKALLISEAVVIGSGVLAGVLANSDAKRSALEFIEGKTIPVPGVDGLNLQIDPVGKEKRFMVNFDLMKFLRSVEE